MARKLLLPKNFEKAHEAITRDARNHDPVLASLLNIREMQIEINSPQSLHQAQFEGTHRFIREYERIFMWVYYLRFPQFKKKAFPWNTPNMRGCKTRAQLYNKQLDLCIGVIERQDVPFDSAIEWWYHQMVEEYGSTLSGFFSQAKPSKREISNYEKQLLKIFDGKASKRERGLLPNLLNGYPVEKQRLFKLGYKMSWGNKPDRAFRNLYWSPFIAAWREYHKEKRSSQNIQHLYFDPERKTLRRTGQRKGGISVPLITEKQKMTWTIEQRKH